MAAVAGLVDPGLGREERKQAMTQGDAAHGFLVMDVAVGCSEGGRVLYLQLLLAPPELRVVPLELHALNLHSLDELTDHTSRRIHPRAGETATPLERVVDAVRSRGKSPFPL